MELKNYIEEGVKIAGSVGKLASMLGVAATTIPDAKAHRRGLPVYACYRLADLLQVDVSKLIAASELVTEKDPARRAIYAPFVHGARTVALALVVNAGIGATAPTPAQADEDARAMYIM